MLIKEVENPRLRDLTRFFKGQTGEMREKILDGIQVVGSGKGAIALVLKYLLEKGVIKNKLDEVIMADWIGSWVYNQVQSFAFPAKKFSSRTKVIFVYHQYGFPQDMDKIMEFAHDKKLIVIEDCAHSLASYYKGKLLGSFGDFTIYSFSKWFFCFALGGVKSKFSDFSEYADQVVQKTPFGLTLFKDSTKLFSEMSSFSHSLAFKKSTDLFMNMAYSVYGEALKPSRPALRLLASKINNEIIIRKKRYSYFLERTEHLGICDHLEKEGITPYIIPVLCSESQSEKLVKHLQEENVMTGIYHFDVNRNLLNPKFMPCVWIPCHGGISDEVFSEITDLVLKSFKK